MRNPSEPTSLSQARDSSLDLISRRSIGIDAARLHLFSFIRGPQVNTVHGDAGARHALAAIQSNCYSTRWASCYSDIFYIAHFDSGANRALVMRSLLMNTFHWNSKRDRNFYGHNSIFISNLSKVTHGRQLSSGLRLMALRCLSETNVKSLLPSRYTP